MKVAIYTPGGGALVGLIQSQGDQVLLQPFACNLVGASREENLDELDYDVEVLYTEDYPDAEAFLRDLARLLPDQVAYIPDDTDIADVWPGSDNDPTGRWILYRPGCPNADEPLPGHPSLKGRHERLGKEPIHILDLLYALSERPGSEAALAAPASAEDRRRCQWLDDQHLRGGEKPDVPALTHYDCEWRKDLNPRRDSRRP